MGSNLCTADWSESTTDYVLPSKNLDRERVIISIFSMLDIEKTGQLDLKSIQARFDEQSNLGSDFWKSVIGMCKKGGVVTQDEFVDLYLTFSKGDSDVVFQQQGNKFIEIAASVSPKTGSNGAVAAVDEGEPQPLTEEEKIEKLAVTKIEEFAIEIDNKMKEEVPLEQDDEPSNDDDDEVIVMTSPKKPDGDKEPDGDKDELLIPVKEVDEIKIDFPRRTVNQRNQVGRVRAPIPLNSLPPELKVFDFDGDGMLNEDELRLAEFSGYEFVEQRLIPLSDLPPELKNFDFNRDGYLDENEIKIAEAHGYRFDFNPPEGRLIPLFDLPAELKQFDFNNDGYLDEQEIRAAERQGYVFQETIVEEIVPDDPNILKRMEFHGDGSLRGAEINAAKKEGFKFVPSNSDKAKKKNPLDQQRHKSLHAVKRDEEKFDIVIGF